MEKQKVIFIGAGGYAKSALDSLDLGRYAFCGFIDAFKPVGSRHLGFPIVSNDIADLSDRGSYLFFISIGNNRHRAARYAAVKNAGARLLSIIDRSALVSAQAQLGEGAFVGKMAIINSGVRIGCNAVINTKALIEHGCIIGDHCNISTNATLNGDVRVEDGCFVGSCSVINGQLVLGRNSVIGSGAVVVRDVAENHIVAGVPAKFIKENQ